MAWGHALSLDPGRPNSALNRGRALLACGHHAEAAKLARKALELSSKLRDPKARASLELAARRLLEESR